MLPGPYCLGSHHLCLPLLKQGAETSLWQRTFTQQHVLSMMGEADLSIHPVFQM